MPLKTRKQILLAKTETTYGTDSAPTGGANAIVISNPTATPFEADQITRNNAQPYLGARPITHVGKRVRLQFEVEVAGSGAAGTGPKWGLLVNACGMAETLVASTSATYNPISDSEPSLTLHFHQDGQRHKLLGARGTFTIRFNAQQYPVLAFDFIGIYADPSSETDPTPTFTGFQAPLEANSVNTPTLSLHSYTSLVLHELEINWGATVNHRDLVGDTSVQIADRSVGGRIVVDAPTITAKDFFAAAKNDTAGGFQIVHGTAAGNIVTINGQANQVQVLSPNYGDREGNLTLEMGLLFRPSSTGNNELSIVCT